MQRLHSLLGIVDVDDVVAELEPAVEANKARSRQAARGRREAEEEAAAVGDGLQPPQPQSAL